MKYHKALGIGLIIYGLIVGFFAFRQGGGAIADSSASLFKALIGQ